MTSELSDYIQGIMPYSRGTEFKYLAKNETFALERYTADFLCIECLNIAGYEATL